MRRRSLVALVLAIPLAGCVNRDIVKPPAQRALASEEIAAGLSSSSFREVLAARAQLPGLPDEVWLAALTTLAHDPIPEHRLIAAAELARRPRGAARALLSALAADPDETVRAEATQRLTQASSSRGVP